MNSLHALTALAFAWLTTGALIAATPAVSESAARISAAPSDSPEILSRIEKAPSHPRLLWTRAQDHSLREKIKSDPEWRKASDAALLTADHMLGEPPVVYRKDGRRLLGRSREALSRSMHLGFAWRITGDDKYLKRAITEMDAMAAMPDWNPSHFLDTAEMTLAMAVGYDWFFEKLLPEQKTVFKKAIEQKGLGPYLKPGARLGWERGRNNWNQVCHAGMLAGALALLEDDPERAAEVVSRALKGLPYAMNVYDPDGNYPEGPSYWNYGTTFNVIAIAVMESALGTDFGVSASPGIINAGQYPLHTMGPTRRYFNFSDCGTGASFSPAMPWFAAKAKAPELMWFQWELLQREIARVNDTKGEAEVDRVFPLAILWAAPKAPRQTPGRAAWFARGENPIATFRTSWTDRNALFLAIKAGTPRASHGHMDIGSFVLDCMGERWSLDLGAQDYNQLEQRGVSLWDFGQNSERWTIFRYHNRGHSTLLVNDARQVVSSKAALTGFSDEPGSMRATIDMSATYSNQLVKAVRKFVVGGPKHLEIRDELEAGNSPAKVRWGMVTPAKLVPDSGGRGSLELNGKKMRIALTGVPATLKSWPADKPPMDYDAPNPGVSIVGFEHDLTPGEQAAFVVQRAFE